MDPSRRAVLGTPLLAAGGGMMAAPGRPEQLDGPLDTLDAVETAIWQAAGEYDVAPLVQTMAIANTLMKVSTHGVCTVHGDGPRRPWLRAAARSMILKAQAQNHAGYPADAELTLSQCETIANACGDGPTMAHVWALRARIADRAGRPYEAIRHAHHGRSLASRTSMSLLLMVKIEAGAWSSAGRPDMVASCVKTAQLIQSRLPIADRAPRGYSLLDDGMHPADVALSAAGAMAVAGIHGPELDDMINQAGEGATAGSHRAAVCIVSARGALARGDHDQAAQLVVDAAAAVGDGRDWLAREILSVGGACEITSDTLGAAMHTAGTWLGHS